MTFLHLLLNYNLEKKVDVADDLDELLLYIENLFNINKDEHFLILPLHGSGLNKDISFLNFHLLSEKNEAEIYSKYLKLLKFNITE